MEPQTVSLEGVGMMEYRTSVFDVRAARDLPSYLLVATLVARVNSVHQLVFLMKAQWVSREIRTETIYVYVVKSTLVYMMAPGRPDPATAARLLCPHLLGPNLP